MYICASCEASLTQLSIIQLSWVKRELSSVPGIQCSSYEGSTFFYVLFSTFFSSGSAMCCCCEYCRGLHIGEKTKHILSPAVVCTVGVYILDRIPYSLSLSEKMWFAPPPPHFCTWSLFILFSVFSLCLPFSFTFPLVSFSCHGDISRYFRQGGIFSPFLVCSTVRFSKQRQRCVHTLLLLLCCGIRPAMSVVEGCMVLLAKSALFTNVFKPLRRAKKPTAKSSWLKFI